MKQESLDTQAEIRFSPAPTTRSSNYERAQFAAMDNLGLEDGDDALQYALMLSMDQDAPANDGFEDVSAFGADTGTGGSESIADGDDAELQEMLEMIRLAEERERERGL